MTSDLFFRVTVTEKNMVDTTTFKSLAMSFPETKELTHFEKTSFRINNKIFATLDESHQKACLKLDEVDQSVFCLIDPTIIYPVNNKWGKQGWTYVELNKVKKNLLKDALSKAYSTVALTKTKK